MCVCVCVCDYMITLSISYSPLPSAPTPPLLIISPPPPQAPKMFLLTRVKHTCKNRHTLFNTLDANVFRVLAVVRITQLTLGAVENILLSSPALYIIKEDGASSLTVYLSSDRLSSCMIKTYMYNDPSIIIIIILL